MEERYDEQAQAEILQRARQLQTEPRASLEDLERLGQELGLSKAHIWQAAVEYEAAAGRKRKKPRSEIEWGAFGVMAVHFVFQLVMVYRWMSIGYMSLFEYTRWYFFLPFAILLGLLAMGSVGKFKRTVAYLIGSMGAGYLLSIFIHSIQGYHIGSQVPKVMFAVLAIEIAVVAVFSIKGLLTDPKRALQQLFGMPSAEHGP